MQVKDSRLTGCFVVVNVDAFQLELGVSIVCSGWVDAVLI